MRQSTHPHNLPTALALVVAASLALGGCSSPAVQTPAATPSTQTTATAPTPTPSAIETVTPGLTEGPYYKPGSPERASIAEPGTKGTVLTVAGRVLDASGQPVANARLEFWQADETGGYDNTTYRYRGHQFSAADGGYRLVTVVPGLYPGRTRHIHVKVIAPGLPELTTQLFFPGEPGNTSDSIFSPDLVLHEYVASGKTARGAFDFVLGQ